MVTRLEQLQLEWPFAKQALCKRYSGVVFFFSVECLRCHGWRWTTRTLDREDVTRLVSVFNELRHWRGTHLLIYIRPLPGGWNWVYCNMKAQMVPCFGQWQGDYSRNDFGTFRSLSCLSTPRCIPWSAEIIQSFSSRSSIGKDKEQTRPDSPDNWRDGSSMVKWTKRIPAWRICDPWHGPDDWFVSLINCPSQWRKGLLLTRLRGSESRHVHFNTLDYKCE